MASPLVDFSAPDRLRWLVDFVTENGRNNELPENFTLLNTSQWILAGEFPPGRISYFACPETAPRFVFIVDESDVSPPHVSVRAPAQLQSEDEELLRSAFRHVFKLINSLLDKHGEFLVEAQRPVRDVLYRMREAESLPFERFAGSECHYFYMNEKQREILSQTELPSVPYGYTVGTLNPLDDYEFIHSKWPFAHLSPKENTRMRIENFPSSCIRAADGKLAAWELTYQLGALNHLFCVEEHRGVGVGQLAENLLAQTLSRSGLRVYKYVVDSNELVTKGSRKSPFWSEWTPENADGKKDDLPWTFTNFRSINKK